MKINLVTLGVVLALSSAAPAFADNSTGSISGIASHGSVVTIKNKNTGLSRTFSVSTNEKFHFRQLPTGNYTVSNGEQSFDIVVTVGGTRSIDFTDKVEVLSVVGSRVSPLDLTSVESATVFTAEDIDRLPITKDLTSVALLAPGTTKGDSGFGNLASFGGASVAENGYYINGFDVTNIRKFTSFANLPYDGVSQQQVKTGGYGAEYGRSLGGVVNIVTKRGSNDWEFGGSAYWTPKSLREDRTDNLSKQTDPSSSEKYHVYNSDNTYDYLKYNVYGSGPIIEDKLFFFAMYQWRDDEWNDFNVDRSTRNTDESPLGLFKLDWNITDSQVLEYTYILNDDEYTIHPYTNPEDEYYTGKHGTPADPYSISDSGDIHILSYTGYITDNLTVNALLGRMKFDSSVRNPLEGPGAECPLVYDRRETPTSSQRIGCWGKDSNQYYRYDPEGETESDTRDSIRLGLRYDIGAHSISFGYDKEEFESTKLGREFSGGDYWRWHRGTGSEVRGVVVPEGQDYVRHRTLTEASGKYLVENTAFYLTDEWQVTDDIILRLGIRAEGFENFNSKGESFVKGDTKYAPRLGFSWDVFGEGDKKLFATAGRYYIPISANTNIRGSGIEFSTEEYFLVDSADEDPTTSAPTKLGAKLGETSYNGDENPPHPGSIAAINLEPMHQDEFILGYQQEFDTWTVGVKAIYREIKDGMDDYCGHQAFINYATDNGYNNFDYNSMANCMMMNPGNNVEIAMDLENDGNYQAVSIPASYFDLDKYKRTYTAVEFFWERAFEDNWYLKGSYSYAKSKGNAEGYVNSTLEQDDAGATQDVDHALFQKGADGYLPNDRRHTLKLFGGYNITEEIAVSANILVQSGRPVSCYGYLPLEQYKDELGVDYSGLAGYSASSFFCQGKLGSRGNEGRTPWVKTVDLGVTYKPEWAENLTLRANIKNAFNSQEVTEYTETSEIGSASAPEANPNYLNASNYLTPRRVELSVSYKF
ncbi:TonB-dependent receptor [Pseudoalteromonas sp. CO348]|uniref:TonB-dependent receptor n=1 Tax=Pseudoalteromonas sp. CO348 TaxID=1777271 RepID=UPI0013EE9B98|nr:TonB-dependent receptor [Pseudoalteromonas sp. CO348]